MSDLAFSSIDGERHVLHGMGSRLSLRSSVASTISTFCKLLMLRWIEVAPLPRLIETCLFVKQDIRTNTFSEVDAVFAHCLIRGSFGFFLKALCYRSFTTNNPTLSEACSHPRNFHAHLFLLSLMLKRLLPAPFFTRPRKSSHWTLSRKFS